MTPFQCPLLANISAPADVKKLRPEDLELLAVELRSFILDVVSTNPGHLGSSLGVVELSIALHYIFDTPNDVLIWDVGHQAYAHKILTGRRDIFDRMRKWQGISGFPVRAESEYDAFGTGHASTALSAALGMAVAANINGLHNRQHIAVVGDGSITGGMFFEALNHAGASNVNLLIILNDNGISIDKSSGALKDYLVQQGNKTLAADTTNPLFEAFDLQCFGPIDGNNLNELLPVLEKMKHVSGVKLLHMRTIKGKGFERAEREQVLFHAPGKFDRTTGERQTTNLFTADPPLYQYVFGETILELATSNPKIVAITPAMLTGSSLHRMMEQFPNRCFDVGIAEQHALTFAAGLAAQNIVPFCVVYSTFLQRAYDQIIHDIALQQLPVVLCIDRAGLVGEDGATHHGAFDLALLRCIPHLTIAAPMDEWEFRNMLYTAQLNCTSPIAIRYPRGQVSKVNWRNRFEKIVLGKGRCIRQGENIAVISIGMPGLFVSQALERLDKEGIHAGHFDIRFLKPLDESLLHEVFKNYKTIISIEDGTIVGGLGSALMEFAQQHYYQNAIVRMGIPDEFISHGKPEILYQHCGFDDVSIEKTVRRLW